MVRACTLAVVCSIGLLPALSLSAQAQDPFGSGEVKSVGEKPFADSIAEPTASDPFAAETQRKQVAATNSHEIARRAKPLSTNERVRSALDETTRMEFLHTPLQDAVNFLKDYHQIEIQLDNRGLEDAGIGSDTPVSRNLGSLPLKSALKILLSDLDLAYVVQDDVLLITTKFQADRMREVRVYNVKKLVTPDAEAEEISKALTMLLHDTIPETMCSAPIPEWQRLRIVPLRDLLVIRASQDEHDEIASVLLELSKALAAHN